MPVVTTLRPLRPADAEALIEATRGRWFTATFVKRTDGSLRRMTCRTGVRAGTTGAGMKFDPGAKALRVVWAADRLTFRMLALDAITELVIAGKKYRACSWCGDLARPQTPGDTYPPYCSSLCWGEEHGEDGSDD